ncbi:MAG: hypothetical protein LQ341_002994 [Variospora aurantia]|nr:MAG: hypothetical protein LQ341_002994 [Variospora aurantia]
MGIAKALKLGWRCCTYGFKDAQAGTLLPCSASHARIPRYIQSCAHLRPRPLPEPRQRVRAVCPSTPAGLIRGKVLDLLTELFRATVDDVLSMDELVGTTREQPHEPATRASNIVNPNFSHKERMATVRNFLGKVPQNARGRQSTHAHAGNRNEDQLPAALQVQGYDREQG